jgi:inorganic pyrophosphatase
MAVPRVLPDLPHRLWVCHGVDWPRFRGPARRARRVSEPTFPGCGVIAKPVAVMELDDQVEREPKVLCVPREDPNWEHVEGLEDLPEQVVEEIAHFFVAYKKCEGHDVEVTV